MGLFEKAETKRKRLSEQQNSFACSYAKDILCSLIDSKSISVDEITTKYKEIISLIREELNYEN